MSDWLVRVLEMSQVKPVNTKLLLVGLDYQPSVANYFFSLPSWPDKPQMRHLHYLQ